MKIILSQGTILLSHFVDIVHTTYVCMKQFDWNEEKNEILIKTRGISFEEIILYISNGDLLDILEHPDKRKYPGQRIFVVNVNSYVYYVPFVEDSERIFLKTIVPSRKLSRKYLNS